VNNIISVRFEFKRRELFIPLAPPPILVARKFERPETDIPISALHKATLNIALAIITPLMKNKMLLATGTECLFLVKVT